MVVRLLFTFGGGIISVIGLSKAGFSGAGALGCLLSAFTAATIWRARDVAETPVRLASILTFKYEILVFIKKMCHVIGSFVQNIFAPLVGF